MNLPNFKIQRQLSILDLTLLHQFEMNRILKVHTGKSKNLKLFNKYIMKILTYTIPFMIPSEGYQNPSTQDCDDIAKNGHNCASLLIGPKDYESVSNYFYSIEKEKVD